MHTTADLETLVEQAPPWAALVSVDGLRSDWRLAPPLLSGGVTPTFPIRIWANGDHLTASETPPSKCLPDVCPELHIMHNGTFCIGKRDFHTDRREDVIEFWQCLGEFLHNQHFARRKRHWPAGRWLSHGPASADAQIAAEAIAAATGISAEYSDWLERGEGWLKPLFNRNNPGLRALPAANDPCPRRCISSGGKPIRFKECRLRPQLTKLIKFEGQRIAGNDRYYLGLSRAGVECCGRVDDCGLASLKGSAR